MFFKYIVGNTNCFPLNCNCFDSFAEYSIRHINILTANINFAQIFYVRIAKLQIT